MSCGAAADAMLPPTHYRPNARRAPAARTAAGASNGISDPGSSSDTADGGDAGAVVVVSATGELAPAVELAAGGVSSGASPPVGASHPLALPEDMFAAEELVQELADPSALGKRGELLLLAQALVRWGSPMGRACRDEALPAAVPCGRMQGSARRCGSAAGRTPFTTLAAPRTGHGVLCVAPVQAGGLFRPVRDAGAGRRRRVLVRARARHGAAPAGEPWRPARARASSPGAMLLHRGTDTRLTLSSSLHHHTCMRAVCTASSAWAATSARSHRPARTTSWSPRACTVRAGGRLRGLLFDLTRSWPVSRSG